MATKDIFCDFYPDYAALVERDVFRAKGPPGPTTEHILGPGHFWDIEVDPGTSPSFFKPSFTPPKLITLDSSKLPGLAVVFERETKRSGDWISSPGEIQLGVLMHFEYIDNLRATFEKLMKVTDIVRENAWRKALQDRSLSTLMHELMPSLFGQYTTIHTDDVGNVLWIARLSQTIASFTGESRGRASISLSTNSMGMVQIEKRITEHSLNEPQYDDVVSYRCDTRTVVQCGVGELRERSREPGKDIDWQRFSWPYIFVATGNSRSSEIISTSDDTIANYMLHAFAYVICAVRRILKECEPTKPAITCQIPRLFLDSARYPREFKLVKTTEPILASVVSDRAKGTDQSENTIWPAADAPHAETNAIAVVSETSASGDEPFYSLEVKRITRSLTHLVEECGHPFRECLAGYIIGRERAGRLVVGILVRGRGGAASELGKWLRSRFFPAFGIGSPFFLMDAHQRVTEAQFRLQLTHIAAETRPGPKGRPATADRTQTCDVCRKSVDYIERVVQWREFRRAVMLGFDPFSRKIDTSQIGVSELGVESADSVKTKGRKWRAHFLREESARDIQLCPLCAIAVEKTGS